MNIDTAEALSLDENSEVSFSQLLVLSGLSDTDLRELVDHGALTPINPNANLVTREGSRSPNLIHSQASSGAST